MLPANKPIYTPQTDPAYACPRLDAQEIRTRTLLDGRTVSFHYLHGCFQNTGVKFLFCMPMRQAYQGRFFQHLSPFPGPDEELASLAKTGEEDPIAMALAYGSGFVESNMGSGAMFGTTQDSTIFYKSSAAVAEYCRTAAQTLYGPHRTYGYVYGGSGGGYKTMSCLENTRSWDGGVPYVIGSPVSLPNCLTVCVHGSRLLRHCWPKIVDALEPGGSGDPYLGLNPEEQDALREITGMGVPPRTVCCYAANDDGALPVLLPVVKAFDPGYFTDFWTKPGYLGANPDGSAMRDRIRLATTVVSAGVRGAASAPNGAPDARNGTDDAWKKMLTDASAACIEVTNVPKGPDLYLRGVTISVESGAAKGKKLHLAAIEGNRLIPGLGYACDDFKAVIGMLRPGDALLLDNSDYIAVQTYHRHQVPADPSFHCFDQYRGADGTPLYPQRPQIISYGFTAGGCGSVQDGHIQSKTIVMNNLMDGDFPWQADWYRRKVASVYGETQADALFRVRYNDNAPHGDVAEGGDPLRVVSYLGMLSQTLLDLADWVEKGIDPGPSTGYRVVENQILPDPDPVRRGGVQPLVSLLADDGPAARVRVGQPVHFCAEVLLPPRAGRFQSAAWSFEGEPDYPGKGGEHAEDSAGRVLVRAVHTYTKPGAYFCTVRVSSGREPRLGYTELRNLARARVIVEA